MHTGSGLAKSVPLAADLGQQNATAIIAAVVLMVLMVFLFLLVLLKCYKRCPSNRLLVIYGKTGSGQAARVLHGGSAIVLPLLQDYEWLSLEPIQVEVSDRGGSGAKELGFELPRTFTVAIGTAPELMQNAAIHLLGLRLEDIKLLAENIIVAQLSKLVDSTQSEGPDPDRDALYAKLDVMLAEGLKPLGLVSISYRRE